MDITKQNRQVLVPTAIDLIPAGFGNGLSLILTYKTALIFHVKSIDKYGEDL